jgi:lipopolysaccharide export system permease protein
MRSIDYYILRQLIFAMILVTLGLTGVLWLTQSLRFIELIVSKGASIGDFLALTILVVPNFLTIILPVSLFAVVLFTYNRLITDRELVVMRAAGMSHWSLARAAMMLAAIATLFGFVLNLWLIPLTVEKFHKLQADIRSNAAGVLLHEGTFNELGDGLTVYVRSRTPDGELMGLIVNDHRDPNKMVTLMAERGDLVASKNGPPKVLMFNGTRQQVTRGSNRLSLLYFDSYAVEFSGDSDSGYEPGRDPREQSIGRLFSTSETELGPVLFRQFRVEGHQRLASPLYNVTFALIAATSLLYGFFNRRGQADRIIIAVIMMVGLQALGLGASNIATRNLDMIPLIYLAPILPALVTAWILSLPAFRGQKGVFASSAAGYPS